MALFDPSAGMFGSAPGSGVLAPAVQSPMAPPPPQQAVPPEVLAKLAELWQAKGQLNPAAYRAQVLKETPGFGHGLGPFGARMGEGPGGWATTIGDLGAAYIMLKAQKEKTDKVADLLGKKIGATGGLAVETAKNQPVFDPVSQGAPLGF